MNNNKLTQANMDRIVETISDCADEAHFSHLASYEEIVAREQVLRDEMRRLSQKSRCKNGK